MSDYCNCCTTNTEHIRQHYDPSALTRPDENPADVLNACRKSFHPDSCPLTLADTEGYIEELKKERDADATH